MGEIIKGKVIESIAKELIVDYTKEKYDLDTIKRELKEATNVALAQAKNRLHFEKDIEITTEEDIEYTQKNKNKVKLIVNICGEIISIIIDYVPDFNNQGYLEQLKISGLNHSKIVVTDSHCYKDKKLFSEWVDFKNPVQNRVIINTRDEKNEKSNVSNKNKDFVEILRDYFNL